MGAFINREGKRYGKLVALMPVVCGKHIRWVCQCDCGNVTYPTSATLGNGHSTSCGCSRKTDEFKTRIRARNHRHGYFGTPEYAAWAGIISRCENPRLHTWENYGGRGIYVDPVWRNDPVAFIRDMGPRPSNKHSVERLDVNGPYAPWNCVWATQTEQANNRRTNVLLTHNGETKTVSMWARQLGVSRTTLSDRLKVRDVANAINFVRRRQGTPIEYNGETKMLHEWAKDLGFSRKGLSKRLKTMSVEQAFTKPKREWPGPCY